jgi:hypothetical protein
MIFLFSSYNSMKNIILDPFIEIVEICLGGDQQLFDSFIKVLLTQSEIIELV